MLIIEDKVNNILFLKLAYYIPKYVYIKLYYH